MGIVDDGAGMAAEVGVSQGGWLGVGQLSAVGNCCRWQPKWPWRKKNSEVKY